MLCNVGTTERILRLILAIAFVAAAALVAMPVALAIVFYVLAAIMLVTALVRFCPLWALFGMSTCEKGTTH